ncbi:MAG: DUF3347 domain-containing protein, partial [Candidatus Eisenbacteria bacterium]|nr:DUF3347 domain-containing protein [Candidatus Eisenbacteria bacterium]
SPIYTIADLDHVWARLDAYESDLEWIRYGQEVAFTTAAYPGETFTGQVVFIDPILNEKTRTAKVRVNVPNPEGRLKPEMFVRAKVHVKLGQEGPIMPVDLAGRWISPMHPEIVKDEPGTCDICGMDLVPAEELGLVHAAGEEPQPPLMIPASAPLITGERAVVYVAAPGKDGVFEGREVLLGHRAGEFYAVKDGLREGEEVVVEGNFKIDSAIQIQAKPSMMNPEGGAAPSHRHGDMERPAAPAGAPQEPVAALDAPRVLRAHLDEILQEYFAIQKALSQDDPKTAAREAEQLQAALDAVDMRQLEGEVHDAWMEDSRRLRTAAKGLRETEDLAAARKTFEALSNAAITATRRYGTTGAQPVLRYHCPMAFDNQGADWLQNKSGTENPYFGSKMFRCGTEEEVLAGGTEQK